MRIVGGELSGRRFAGPRTEGTRPTSERVREAIASALEARGWIEGAVVLDLWAGTGAMAFEALSRGAVRAVLVEKDRGAARAIEASAAALGLAERAKVVNADLEGPTRRWADDLDAPSDLVFCDPPYARVERVAAVLAELDAAGKLAEDAAIVVEHAKKQAPTLPAGFSEVRTYRYGDTAVLVAAHTERRSGERG